MKAARLDRPKHYDIIDIETPNVKDGQCLIKLEAWSVCGSDIRHHYGVVHPEEEYPMRIGGACHECAGTVVESKSDKFRVGQRVIVLPSREGTGGLVEYYAGDEDRMAALPDSGPIDQWLMCQPSGTVLYALQQAGTILGKTALVAGQGSIGLSFTAILARAGARKVIAVDLLDYRLEYSKRFGATHTINPSKVNVDEAVAEITGGKMVDLTVEAAGFPETLDMALRLPTKFGKVILFGILAGDINTAVPINTSNFQRTAATIIPTNGAGSGDPITHIETMIELKDRGWWNPGEMVTHRLRFEEVTKAYDTYENYEDNVVKSVMIV
jgi:L-iditol 2-dehydrogenase